MEAKRVYEATWANVFEVGGGAENYWPTAVLRNGGAVAGAFAS